MIRRLVRRLIARRPPAPRAVHGAFLRACLPGNARGKADLDLWLAEGGLALLARAGSPFKEALPALADALDQRGERAPAGLSKILAFAQVIERVRAERYATLVQDMAQRLAAAGLSGLLGADAAAARLAYRRADVRHVTGIHILVPARDLSRLETLGFSAGFARRRMLRDGIELTSAPGARLVLGSRLFAADDGGVVDRLLATAAPGLDLLPRAHLFAGCCMAGYPPADGAHVPPMLDAALLAPLLDVTDWARVADLLPAAGREPLIPALRYLRDELGVSMPLSLG